MQYSMFLVDDDPHCVWEWDIKEKNLEFLEQIDPDYFVYLACAHFENLKGENGKRAALALRTGYLHGLETLFALLCATLQAPDCVVGWMQKYRPHQVRSMIKKIVSGPGTIFNKLGMTKVSLEKLSEQIHIYSNVDKERAKETTCLFANLWVLFSSEFLEDTGVNEYNSIQHGLRVRSGGFWLSYDMEKEYGVSPPPENMRSMGGSDYGSTFFATEKIKGNPNPNDRVHFRVRRNSVNWDPESLAHALNLISASIGNIISFLKIINGIEPGKVKFTRPQESAYFNKPWDNDIGVLSTSMNMEIPSEKVKFFNKKDIVEKLGKSNLKTNLPNTRND
ncbi:MAG: hypothetical protein HZA02_10270 [Nitrospinae bacterium]|nr:hypothetical protein [Nitrospinota bacterium]